MAPVTVWPNADDVHRRAITEQANQNCDQHCILFLIIISGLLDFSAQTCVHEVKM
jgi:hypothetical protein